MQCETAFSHSVPPPGIFDEGPLHFRFVDMAHCKGNPGGVSFCACGNKD